MCINVPSALRLLQDIRTVEPDAARSHAFRDHVVRLDELVADRHEGLVRVAGVPLLRLLERRELGDEANVASGPVVYCSGGLGSNLDGSKFEGGIF